MRSGRDSATVGLTKSRFHFTLPVEMASAGRTAENLRFGYLSASHSPEARPAVTKDTEIPLKGHSISMMEDFGRFSPAETPDLDAEITDESFDEMYAEENAGA